MADLAAREKKPYMASGTIEAYERLVETHLENNSLWGLPIGFFGQGKGLKNNPHRGSLLHLQITLKEMNLSDQDRYEQLSLILGRPITSTYQLRVCEVKALPPFAHLLFAAQPPKPKKEAV